MSPRFMHLSSGSFGIILQFGRTVPMLISNNFATKPGILKNYQNTMCNRYLLEIEKDLTQHFHQGCILFFVSSQDTSMFRIGSRC